MVSEITVEVGDLYENLHVNFSDNLDDAYERALRKNIEDFLHNYNQQLDRQTEQNPTPVTEE
jgi:DNA-binding protein Fis